MLIDLLELASNNALEHDPQTRERLAKLQGKTMTLVIKPFGDFAVQSISVKPQPHGLEFSKVAFEQPDITLTTTLSALVKISRDGINDAELKTGELEIHGDPIIGQRFAGVIAELDIDWQALLAEHIGESPAVLLSDGFSKAKELGLASQSVIKQQINHLLKQDMQIIVDKTDVEPFLDGVDALRADAERLQIRLRQLQDSLN